MAEFPVDPMLSKAIIQSEAFNCTDEVSRAEVSGKRWDKSGAEHGFFLSVQT
jgi:hypothetical protein